MNELSATRQAWERLLVGKRVLIVESDFFIAGLMADDLAEAGADVIGPVESADEALSLIGEGPRPDGAVLDVDLQDERILDLAARLTSEDVPVALSSVLSRDLLHSRVRRVPLLHKAAETWEISRALFGLGAGSSPQAGGAMRN